MGLRLGKCLWSLFVPMRNHGRPGLACFPTDGLCRATSVGAPIPSVAVFSCRDNRHLCGMHQTVVTAVLSIRFQWFVAHYEDKSFASRESYDTLPHQKLYGILFYMDTERF